MHGDQLTVKMMQVAQNLKSEPRESKKYRDLQFLLRILGDFHLFWTNLMSIFENHYKYGENARSNVGSLGALAKHLGKINLNPECKIFRNSENFIKICLEGSIIYLHNNEIKNKNIKADMTDIELYEFLSPIADIIVQNLQNSYVYDATPGDALKDRCRRTLYYTYGRDNAKNGEAEHMLISKKHSWFEFLGGKHCNYALHLGYEWIQLYCDYSERHAYEAIYNRFLQRTPGLGKKLHKDEYLEFVIGYSKHRSHSTCGRQTVKSISTVVANQQYHEGLDGSIDAYLGLNKNSSSHTNKDTLVDILKVAQYLETNDIINLPINPDSLPFKSSYRCGQDRYENTDYVLEMMDRLKPTQYPGVDLRTQSKFSVDECNQLQVSSDNNDLVLESSSESDIVDNIVMSGIESSSQKSKSSDSNTISSERTILSTSTSTTSGSVVLNEIDKGNDVIFDSDYFINSKDAGYDSDKEYN
jgi:hypothetical protein